MGYVKQDDIAPIMAKEYILKNWAAYRVADTKEEFVALLNIYRLVVRI